MKITFYGGVQSVTGANYLVESEKTKILVDCGLYQGNDTQDQLNFEPFPYDSHAIDALIITHSHIDHIGRVPAFVKAGFKGKIYSTPPTRDASYFLLLDSEHLVADVARHLHHDVLYSVNDIEAAFERWEGVPYYHSFAIGDLTITLYNAGHILGSSCVLVHDAQGKRVVFSGDLGNSPAPIIGDRDALPETDWCVLESAYGDRVHEDRKERRELLEDAIEDTVRRGGVLMIPAFAMERTQELLSELDTLIAEGRIPRLPVFMDSPLAIKLTSVYKKYRDYLKGDGDLDLSFPGLQMTETTEQSKAINDVPPPKVIIAGSGMSNGGRILHHERRYLPDPRSTLLIIGYQAEGTFGRRLIEGAKTVSLFGEEISVQCRVKNIAGYSAHADQAQLLQWLEPRHEMIQRVFLVQGEADACAALATKIRDELAVNAEMPEVGKKYIL